MADLSPDQIAAYQARVDADPRFQELLRAYHTNPRTTTGRGVGQSQGALDHYSDQLKQALGIPSDYEIQVGNGRAVVQKKSFLDRNAAWVIPAIVAGGGFGVAALAGAGGAAAGGGTLASTSTPATASADVTPMSRTR